MSGPPASKKRKIAPETARTEVSSSTARRKPQSRALIAPHEAIVAELSSKYDVLPVSIISSSQITKRVTSATTHLLAKEASKLRIVLLHARAKDVGKMITVAEQIKRVVKEEGRDWWQYNELFKDLEKPRIEEESEVVEETVLEPQVQKDGSENEPDDDDDFEVMPERFEKAIAPAPTKRTPKSLRVFLAVTGVSELKVKATTTVQTSTET